VSFKLRRGIIVIWTSVVSDGTVPEKNEGEKFTAGCFKPRKIEKEHFRDVLSERISSKGRTEKDVLQEERKPRNHFEEVGAKGSSRGGSSLCSFIQRAELACIKCGRRGWLCEG